MGELDCVIATSGGNEALQQAASHVQYVRHEVSGQPWWCKSFDLIVKRRITSVKLAARCLTYKWSSGKRRVMRHELGSLTATTSSESQSLAKMYVLLYDVWRWSRASVAAAGTDHAVRRVVGTTHPIYRGAQRRNQMIPLCRTCCNWPYYIIYTPL